MKNATLWLRSSCLGCPLSLLPPRHEERDHKVTFFVSGWSLCPSHHLPLSFPSLSPFSLSRTPERAHVGLFWCSGASPLPSLVLNTTTCLCGHVLVLGHLTSPSPLSLSLPSSQTSVLYIVCLVFTFLVNFYIRIVSFFVFKIYVKLK